MNVRNRIVTIAGLGLLWVVVPLLAISDAHVSNRIVLGVVGAVVSVALARAARRRLPAAA